MTEVRYEAHPAIFRLRPIATLITVVVMLVGILLAGLGDQIRPEVLARLGIPWTGQTMQYLGVAFAGLGCVRLWVWYAPTRFEKFTITDDALLRVRGFSTKQHSEVSRDAVHDVQVTQTWLQRLTDVCDVSVFTAGAPTAIVVRGMPEPARLRALLRDWLGSPAV